MSLFIAFLAGEFCMALLTRLIEGVWPWQISKLKREAKTEFTVTEEEVR